MQHTFFTFSTNRKNLEHVICTSNMIRDVFNGTMCLLTRIRLSDTKDLDLDLEFSSKYKYIAAIHY